MTPLDEMRAGFEAKHKVPEEVEWREDEKEYCPIRLYSYAKPLELLAYNALWQGYQSAMEDRGEAVAYVRTLKGKMDFGEYCLVDSREQAETFKEDYGPRYSYMPLYAMPVTGDAIATLRLIWQRHAGGGCYEYKLMLDSMEYETTLDAYDALCQKLGPGEHKLYTAPQPAPDQWNAVTEAIDNIKLCFVDLVADKVALAAMVPLGRLVALEKAILALRKGA